MPDKKDTYTVAEAAKRLGIGRNTAYEGIRTNEIPHIKIGGRILVPTKALEKMLETGNTPAAA
jgi:excisionase family DNA binding protein